MSKKQGNGVFINMASYLCLQVVNLLVGIVLPRLYLATYGSEVNGIISTVNSFITYFAYLEAGLGLTLIHSLFKPLAKNETEKTSEILSFSKKQYEKISYIYLALVVGFSLLFPLLNHSEDLGTGEFITLVFVIGIYGAVDFYTMAKYRVLLTADRKEYMISFAMIIAQFARFILVWLLLRFELSVTLVKTVPILTLMIRTIILRIYVKKKYPQLSFSKPCKKDTVETTKRWDALIMQISISSSMALPAIFISQVLGFKEASVYAVYSLVISAIIAVVSSLSSGMSPFFGRILASGGEVRKYYDVYSLVVSVILTIFFSVCGAMMLPFVNLYVSVVDDINYMRPTYALLLPLWASLHTFRMPLTALINASGLYRETRVTNILNLVIQVAAGFLMTIVWGANGMLATIIIAALQRNFGMSLVINKHLMPKSWSVTMKHQLVMAAIIVATFFVGRWLIPVESITVIGWVGWAVLSIVTVALLSLLVFFLIDGATVKEAFKMLIGKMKRKVNN